MFRPYGFENADASQTAPQLAAPPHLSLASRFSLAPSSQRSLGEAASSSTRGAIHIPTFSEGSFASGGLIASG
jgi:hypothetical protein